MTAPPGQIDLNRFTMDRYYIYSVNITFTELLNLIYLFISFRYKAIVKYKTAFYSFYLPVAAAMYIVSITNLRGTTE